MKKNILIFISVLLLWQCASTPKPVTYIIKGKIDGVDNKQVILSTFDRNLKSKALDTVIVKDSIFEFKISKQNPSIAIVSIKESKISIPVILGDGNIDMVVNKSNPFQSDLLKTTSHLTQKFFLYEKKVLEDQNKGISLMQKYRVTSDEIKKDSLKKVFLNWQKTAKNAQYDFIEKNKDIVGLIIMQSVLSAPDIDFQRINSAYNTYPLNVQNTNLGKYIHTFLLIKGATKVGGKAPNFIGTTPEGNKLSLTQAMGRITIIDFWASWCQPCRMENPYMVEIYNKYHDQGLNIISVSLDKNKKSWLKAIKDDGLIWQHVSELKYWQEPIAKQYGVTTIPQTFILDAKGIIRAKNLRRKDLEKKIEELLNE